MLPNGLLDRRLAVTLTGTKDVVGRLDSQDFEVVIDAADKGDEWVVQVSKKNLVSLNPDIELMHNISSVSYNEFILHLSRLLSERIPVYFAPPKGEAPDGYQFLDVSPQKLYQTVVGPEEDVLHLRAEGLEVSFDLTQISREDLDSLPSNDKGMPDEVSFPVPDSWKKIRIPFLGGALHVINSPEAKNIHIDFLRKSILPLGAPIPVQMYYPASFLGTVNPKTYQIESGDIVASDHGISVIACPLYVQGVSRLFLDLVKDRIELLLVPNVMDGQTVFSWKIQFIDPDALEDLYVFRLSALEKNERGLPSVGGPYQARMKPDSATVPLFRQQQWLREKYLRSRFKEYIKQFQLFYADGTLFSIEVDVSGGNIFIRRPSAFAVSEKIQQGNA